MYKEIWTKHRASVAVIHFYSDKNILLNSITGFRYSKYLITDPSAYSIEKAHEVEITFPYFEVSGKKFSIRLTIKEFKQSIIKSIKENAALILLKLEALNQAGIPSLKIAKKRYFQEGAPIAMLGYQQDHRIITIKSGIISAFLKSGNLPFIQFDISMSQGNPGSPLILPETGEVIGIAGYRLAIINKNHNKLMKIINTNLEKIKKLEGKYKHDNLDISQILAVTENQIKHLAHELNRSASFMYGFALELPKMIDLFPSE